MTPFPSQAYSEEKEHIIELLAELSRVREEEAVAEEERIRLEATVSTDTSPSR
jgi:hypothetical protein